jgi:hypothetical protein
MDAIAIIEKTNERTGEKKTHFLKVGAAFPTKDGTGWMIYLDAFPVAGKLMLKPPREDGNRGGSDMP